jgi:hypothetical protein
MKPDITNAYGILHRDYASMCRFGNAVEDEFGIKKVEVKGLGKNRTGLVLAMIGPSCSYELHLQNGSMLLGRFYQGRRQMVYKGSPSVQGEWDRMFEAVRGLEKRMKVEASRMPSRKVTIDVEALKRDYKPKLDIGWRLRM